MDFGGEICFDGFLLGGEGEIVCLGVDFVGAVFFVATDADVGVVVEFVGVAIIISNVVWLVGADDVGCFGGTIESVDGAGFDIGIVCSVNIEKDGVGCIGDFDGAEATVHDGNFGFDVEIIDGLLEFP